MGDSAEARDTYHHGDLRQALLSASLELIEEGGVQALSLRGAARKAGVSSGAPYHHFANRGALLRAIAEDGFAILADRIDARREGVTDPSERLAACGLAYIAFARECPAHFKVMFRPELMDPDAEASRPGDCVFKRLVEGVTEAQAAGCAPPGDPERIILTAWSVAHGLSSLLVDGPLCHFDKLTMKPEEMGPIVMRTIVELFKAGS